MKPILVATDFSPAANHAVDYAARLAHAIHAPLIIFHSWMLPSVGGEMIAVPYPITEMEELNQELVEKEAERIHKNWGIEVRPFQTMGFAVDEIENFSRSLDVGLVVMGMHHTGRVLQIFGSVVTAFIKRDKFPVLVIPEGSKYVLPKRILFATDFNTKASWQELDLLKTFASIFNARIDILNVVPDEVETVPAGTTAKGTLLQKIFENYPHSWQYGSGGDIPYSICKISDELHADWIAAIPHHMNWFRRLINTSTSKQLSFKTNLPLLILPEHHADL